MTSLALHDMLLPCVFPDSHAPSAALPSCEPVATTSSASDTPSGLPEDFIITLTADPHDPLIAVATGLSSDSASPNSTAAQMPTAPTPPEAAPTTLSNTTSNTLATLASVPVKPSSPASKPPSPTSTTPAFDPFSSPSTDYRPGTPPVLIVLYVVVIVWTLLFGYAMYHIYRCDARPRRVAAHPQWRRNVTVHGQRSPKKVGGRFEIRGLGEGEGGRDMGVRMGRIGM